MGRPVEPLVYSKIAVSSGSTGAGAAIGPSRSSASMPCVGRESGSRDALAASVKHQAGVGVQSDSVEHAVGKPRAQRYGDRPEPQDREERDHPASGVLGEDADVVAVADAPCGEPARHPGHEAVELVVGEAHRRVDGQIGQGGPVEAERGLVDRREARWPRPDRCQGAITTLPKTARPSSSRNPSMALSSGSTRSITGFRRPLRTASSKAIRSSRSQPSEPRTSSSPVQM